MNTKKETILRVVLKFLWSDEIHEKLTISNVAKHLDMGKSTLYEYFENKDQMIQEAILLMIEENTKALLTEEKFDTLSFKEAFSRHMRRSCDIAAQNQMIQHVMESMDYVTMSKALKDTIMMKMFESYQQSKERMIEIIGKGLQEKLIKSEMFEHRSKAVESMLIGSLISYAHPLNDWERDSLIQELYESIVALYN